jgi:hypothetical protein
MIRTKGNTPSLFSRIKDYKKRLETEADQIGPGSARDKLTKKLRQVDVAVHINEWLSSLGLRAPK